MARVKADIKTRVPNKVGVMGRAKSWMRNTKSNLANRRLLKEQRMNTWATKDPKSYGEYMTKRANRGTMLAGLAGSAGNLLAARLPELMDRFAKSGLTPEQINKQIKDLKDVEIGNKGGIVVRDKINPGQGGKSKAPAGGSTSNSGMFGF